VPGVLASMGAAVSDLTAVSLFAGIGGFDLALQRSGVRVVAAVEIDEGCRGVLARHFPGTRLFSDVREVTGADLRAAGLVPERGIITAGWPCQGNSVAGRRGGLADPRSGLWAHALRLLAETGAAWFIGENVPGLLSVNGGADFGSVIGGLAGIGMGFCWRVLDAQHFGVPQRRRRVFIVGRAGDRAARLPVQVLLEPEGGTGHPAAGGAAWQDAAGTPGSRARESRTVGTLGTSGPGGGWRIGADEAAAGQLVTATLQGGGRRGHRIDAEGAAGGHLIVSQNGSDIQVGDQLGALTAGMARQTSGDLIAFDTAQLTHAENRANPAPGDPAPTLNANGQVHVAETAYALTSRASRASRASREETYITTHAITTHEGSGPDSDATTGLIMAPMAFNPQTGGDMRLGYGEMPTALQREQITAVQTSQTIRRLTPTECERLMGFPDGWTDGQSDSGRYRQLGNSVAVPCVEWVTRRVVLAEASGVRIPAAEEGAA
jgi:DNA (cytosine-5)-methyltransferase 1